MRRAALALAGEQYNRELHPDEIAKLNDLKQGKSPEEQQRINDAACALTHCSAGVPDNDPNKAILVASEQRGQADASEQQELKGTGLYTYDNLDALGDFSRRNELGTRALGGLQWIGGSAQAVGSAASACVTGAGCLVAGYLFTSGVDNAQAGFQTLINGTVSSTWGAQALQGLGMSPGAAATFYAATQLGTGLGQGIAANQAANAEILVNQLARLSYTPGEEFAPQGLQVTQEVMQTPQAQAILNEYIKSGIPEENALDYTRGLLSSGRELPLEITAGSDMELIKIVPKNLNEGDGVGSFTPYFMTREQYDDIAHMAPDRIASYLGLPAEQGIRGSQLGFDVYSMMPKPGETPTVFSSEIAPTKQGDYSAWGGWQQILVPNRNAWTDPNKSKIGEIKGKLWK